MYRKGKVVTWTDYHRRDEAIRTVLELADSRADGLLPWDEVPAAEELFGTPSELLRALQMRWHTHLAGSLDELLAEEPMDLEVATVRGWCRAAVDMPGARAILDANRDHTAIAAGRRKDFHLLASTAGFGFVGDAYALRAGEALEERARAGAVNEAPAIDSGLGGLVRLLRLALASAA